MILTVREIVSRSVLDVGFSFDFFKCCVGCFATMCVWGVVFGCIVCKER